MNRETFDEQCRLCRFLRNPPPCGRENLRLVSGVNVCTSYEPTEI